MSSQRDDLGKRQADLAGVPVGDQLEAVRARLDAANGDAEMVQEVVEFVMTTYGWPYGSAREYVDLLEAERTGLAGEKDLRHSALANPGDELVFAEPAQSGHGLVLPLVPQRCRNYSDSE